MEKFGLHVSLPSNIRGLIVYLFFFSILVIYLWIVFPDIYWGDSAEFAFRALFLGIPHPTGYPTYIQLSNLFTHFPVGSIFFLMNFSSAFFGFLAVVVLYQIAFLLTERHLPSLFTVILFAFSRVYLFQLRVMEVYTLHILILLLLVYLYLLWLKDSDGRKLLALSFIAGLGLTHHMTTVIVAVIIGLFFLFYEKDRKVKLKVSFLAASFFLIGLFSYYFLFARNELPAPINYLKYFGMTLSSLEAWYWLLSGKLFRYEMTSGGFQSFLNGLGFFAYNLFREFFYVPVVIGFLGILGHYRSDKKGFLFLFSVFLSLTLFSVWYRIPDIQDYHTMSFVLFALWIALGVKRILEISQKSFIKNIIYFGIIAFSIAPVISSFSAGNGRYKEYPLEYAHKLFATLPENAVISTNYIGKYTIYTIQKIGGIRTDVKVLDYGNISLAIREKLSQSYDPDREGFSNVVKFSFRKSFIPYLKREIISRPAFFSRDEAFLYDEFVREKLDEGIYRIKLKDPPVYVPLIPREAKVLSLLFDKSLRLEGYCLKPDQLMEGEQFLMDFYWQVYEPLDKDIVGVLLFKKSDEGKISPVNNTFLEFTLGSNMLSPKRWRPRAILKDSFQFSLGGSLLPGEYIISLSLFERSYFENTPFDKLRFNFVNIGKVNIKSNPKLVHYWDE